MPFAHGTYLPSGSGAVASETHELQSEPIPALAAVLFVAVTAGVDSASTSRSTPPDYLARRVYQLCARCVAGLPVDRVQSWCRSAPNQRLKLSARGGRVVGNGSVLSAAAAGRSLSAIR